MELVICFVKENSKELEMENKKSDRYPTKNQIIQVFE